MGRFPELTPVHRQTTEAWLPTPGAGDITLSLEWTPTSTRHWDPAGRVVAWWEWILEEEEAER